MLNVHTTLTLLCVNSDRYDKLSLNMINCV